jgi:uncharacterized membrane protein
MWSIPHHYRWVLRALASFVAGELTFLCFDFTIILGSNAEQTRRRAAAYDPGRAFIWVIVLSCSVVGLFASAFVLRRAPTLAPENAGLAYALSLLSVVTAWFLTNASFALRYAHR